MSCCLVGSEGDAGCRNNPIQRTGPKVLLLCVSAAIGLMASAATFAEQLSGDLDVVGLTDSEKQRCADCACWRAAHAEYAQSSMFLQTHFNYHHQHDPFV